MLNSAKLGRIFSTNSGRTCWRDAMHAAIAIPTLCAAFVCGWLVAPPTARADTTIAGDLDIDVPVSTDYAKTGGGFGIRIGQEFHLPLIAINPEVGFAYASFADHNSNLGYSGPTIYRGIAGLRLGVGELFRIGVLAHVGFGYISVDVPPALKLADPSHTAFTYDVGLFLDFTALPLLNIGVHAAYNRVAGKDNYEALQWIQLGAHAALVF